jgi:hypothetical protein
MEIQVLSGKMPLRHKFEASFEVESDERTNLTTEHVEMGIYVPFLINVSPRIYLTKVGNKGNRIFTRCQTVRRP